MNILIYFIRIGYDPLCSYEITRIRRIFRDLVIGSIIVASRVSRYKEQSRDPGRSYTLLLGLLLRPRSKCSRSLKITKVDYRQESGLNN